MTESQDDAVTPRHYLRSSSELETDARAAASRMKLSPPETEDLVRVLEAERQRAEEFVQGRLAGEGSA